MTRAIPEHIRQGHLDFLFAALMLKTANDAKLAHLGVMRSSDGLDG